MGKFSYNKMFTSDNTQIDPGQGILVSETEPHVEVVDPPNEPKTYFITNCNSLNMRNQPNKDGRVLCVLKSGAEVVVENISDGWAHIYLSSGIDGYVMEEYLKEE